MSNKTNIKKGFKKIIPKKFHPKIRQVYSYLNAIIFKNERKHQFFKTLGYKLNLKDPKSFNEKIIWKKLFDRNPLIPLTTDKYRVRQYIEEKLGKDKVKEHLIPLLYVTDRPETIPFNELPDEYIIKPNHGCDWYIIAENVKGDKKYIISDYKKLNTFRDTEEARIEIIKVCNMWLNTTYGFAMNEWAYQKIEPLIIIEKLLRDSYDNIPNDYKFFMFHGNCKVIYVCSERFSNIKLTFYDMNWNLLNVSLNYRPKKPIKKPETLDQMILISEKLSEDFDFVRIDLFVSDNSIYCGEITHYPCSGFGKFTPTDFDFELGKYWKIK